MGTASARRKDVSTRFSSGPRRGERWISKRVVPGAGPADAPLRDAVAIFSQSQLHFLGLASFLARAMREPNGFMVFDDPVVSSDEDYRAHFVCTVLEELIKLGQQMILLTQDQRTWKDIFGALCQRQRQCFQIMRDTGVTTVTKPVTV